MAIYKKVTDLVGNTPILELGNYEEKNLGVGLCQTQKNPADV